MTAALQTPGAVLAVIGDGQVSVGAWASLMVTVKLHEVIPWLLLAVQVTVVVPIAKAVPEGGAQVTVGTGQPAEVVGVVKVSTEVQRPGSVVPTMFEGQVIAEGACRIAVTVGFAAPATDGSSVNTVEKLLPDTEP